MDRYFIDCDDAKTYYVFDRVRGFGAPGRDGPARERALARCSDPEIARLLADLLNQHHNDKVKTNG